MTPTGPNRLAAFMTSSWVLLAGLAAGLALPRVFPEAVPYVRPIGQAYGLFLRMTVIPFAVAAIVSSLMGILRDRDPDNLIRRALAYAVGCFFILLLSGVLATAALGERVMPDEEGVAKIGELMLQRAKPGEVADNWAVFEIEADRPDAPDAMPRWLRLALDSVPDNVFRALSEGNMIQIALFFVLFSLTARSLPAHAYMYAHRFFTGVFQGVSRIMRWLFLAFAPGMACLLAGSLEPVDMGMLWRLRGFMFLLGGLLIGWALAFFLVLWRKSGRGLGETFARMRDPLLMAAAAGKGVAMPKVMDALEALGLPAGAVRMLIPVGLVLNPSGKALLLSVAATYCAVLYEVPMRADTFAVLLLTVPAAAVAAVQVSPLVWYGFVAIPLGSLGVSIDPVLILLYTLDVVMFKIMTVTEVCLASALVSVVQPRNSIHGKK